MCVKKWGEPKERRRDSASRYTRRGGGGWEPFDEVARRAVEQKAEFLDLLGADAARSKLPSWIGGVPRLRGGVVESRCALDSTLEKRLLETDTLISQAPI